MGKENKKILIVEDDENFLWLLKQGFEGENISVLSALDGQEGFDMAEKENPDLIIADILLPKIDGITMVKKMKEKGIKSQIIFLTNFKDVEHINEAIETVKEIEYIVKSDTHVDQIVERVKNKLHKK